MTTEEYRKTDNFHANTWINRLFERPRPTHSEAIEFGYRLMVSVFIFASLCHLWLADAWTGEWLLSNIIFLIGLFFLLIRASALGWVISALACAIPLFFHRDVLTQSVILLTISFSGFVFTSVCIARPSLREKYLTLHLSTVGWLGMLAYFFAWLHKFNRDFLNPDYSCAVYGFEKVQKYYGFQFSGFDDYLAGIVLVVELSIPFLYLLKQKFAARIVAILFHIPLTLTMAPAFVFVMAISHVAFIDRAERTILWEVLKKRAILLILGAFLATATSLFFHHEWPEWTMIPREFILWFCLFWMILSASQSTKTPYPRPSFLVLLVFALNCASPYLGVQYQHSAAMLSNLRIDEGCWNSLIIPEGTRLRDEYVRIEKVHFIEPGRIEEYEKIVLEQLWSPPQILQMRRNWCSDAIRPFYMEGTFLGRSFAIQDLCDHGESWPFEDDGIFNVELFPDALRFQKNLYRDCPQSCVH